MNNLGTTTKTSIKTSTKVIVGFLALGSIVAGLVVLQKKGLINSKLVPSSSTTTPTGNTSTVGASGPVTTPPPSSSTVGVSGPQPTPSTSTSSTLSTTPVCTEADWTSAVTPRVCPNSGRQTRTWIKTGTCVNGVRHVSPESIYCVAGM